MTGEFNRVSLLDNINTMFLAFKQLVGVKSFLELDLAESTYKSQGIKLGNTEKLLTNKEHTK